MVLIRILFWFIVFYSLFKLLVRVVLPFVIKKALQSKMKDLKQNMGEFEARQQTPAPQSNATKGKEAQKATTGDYIDFEDVK